MTLSADVDCSISMFSPKKREDFVKSHPDVFEGEDPHLY